MNGVWILDFLAPLGRVKHKTRLRALVSERVQSVNSCRDQAARGHHPRLTVIVFWF